MSFFSTEFQTTEQYSKRGRTHAAFGNMKNVQVSHRIHLNIQDYGFYTLLCLVGFVICMWNLDNFRRDWWQWKFGSCGGC